MVCSFYLFFCLYLTQQLLTSAQTSLLLIHLTCFHWPLSISLLPVRDSSSKFMSCNKAFLSWPHPALSSLTAPNVLVLKWMACCHIIWPIFMQWLVVSCVLKYHPLPLRENVRTSRSRDIFSSSKSPSVSHSMLDIWQSLKKSERNAEQKQAKTKFTNG